MASLNRSSGRAVPDSAGIANVLQTRRSYPRRSRAIEVKLRCTVCSRPRALGMRSRRMSATGRFGVERVSFVIEFA